MAAKRVFGMSTTGSPVPATQSVLKLLGETPPPRPAFRPCSPGASTSATPLSQNLQRRAASPGLSKKPSIVDQLQRHASAALGRSPVPAASKYLAHHRFQGGGSSPSRADEEAADEYITMALMLHLPITFGVHYNRQNKGAIRTITSPQGPFVQPVHRNISHSWTAADVQTTDLYVLFLPFHRLSTERLKDEMATVERYMLETKKFLVLTPQAQRSRRWFLHDMLNYVLPKTELLLNEMVSLLERFGVDDVVYQMGVIRLLDESQREKEDVLAVAMEESDGAMPLEIMRFSSGRLKDVLHSGNLTYAVRRLREQYFPKSSLNHQGTGLSERPEDGLSSGASAGVSKIDAIDREIHKLEQRMADDVWGNEGDAEDHDDVEPAFDENEGQTSAAQDSHHLSPHGAGHQIEQKPTKPVRGGELKPETTLSTLNPSRYLDPSAAIASAPVASPPKFVDDDFDAMYRAVEEGYAAV